MLPLISVIIPVFDRLLFLREAIASVLHQTYARREILVVDDGSTADVAPVAQQDSSTVLVLRKQNGGLGSARNHGLRHANGEYVLFLDDDDVLESHALELLIGAAMSAPGSAWAAGRFIYIDEQGKPLRKKHRGQFESGDVYHKMIRGNQLGAPCAVLAQTRAVLEAGGFERDCLFHGCEDYDLWLTLSRDWPLAAVSAVVARYRIHSANMSRSWGRMYESQLEVLRKHRQRARPASEWLFDRAIADCRVAYGDDLYVSGRAVEARREWRLAAEDRKWLLWRAAPRFLKSYLPPPVLAVGRSIRRLSPWSCERRGPGTMPHGSRFDGLR